MVRNASQSTKQNHDKVNPNVVEGALKNMDKEEKPSQDTSNNNNEKKYDERFLHISMNTYVQAITASMGFAKQALNLELAVCLSVFGGYGNTSKEAKNDLYAIYAEAGYNCSSPEGDEYKTVNRRVNTAADLFEHIGGKETIDEWTLATSEMQSIQAIINRLTTEYSFRGMNSILAYVGKAQKPSEKQNTEKKQGEQTEAKTTEGHARTDGIKSDAVKGEEVSQEPSKGQEEPSEEDKALMQKLGGDIEQGRSERAAEKEDRSKKRERVSDKDSYVISTSHAYVAIKNDIPHKELMDIIYELMAAANTLQVIEKEETAVAG